MFPPKSLSAEGVSHDKMRQTCMGKPLSASLPFSFQILPPAACNVFPQGRTLWLHGGGPAKHQTTASCMRQPFYLPREGQ